MKRFISIAVIVSVLAACFAAAWFKVAYLPDMTMREIVGNVRYHKPFKNPG